MLDKLLWEVFLSHLFLISIILYLVLVICTVIFGGRPSVPKHPITLQIHFSFENLSTFKERLHFLGLLLQIRWLYDVSDPSRRRHLLREAVDFRRRCLFLVRSLKAKCLSIITEFDRKPRTAFLEFEPLWPSMLNSSRVCYYSSCLVVLYYANTVRQSV